MSQVSSSTPQSENPTHAPPQGNGVVAKSLLPKLRKWQWARIAALLLNVIVLLFVLLASLFGQPVSSSEAPSEGLPTLLVILFLAGIVLTVTNVVLWVVLPVRWDCPHCNRNLDAELSWECTKCTHVNRNVFFSFLLFCGNYRCRCAPDAFECPKCKGLTHFKEVDLASANVAKCVRPVSKVRDESTDEVSMRVHSTKVEAKRRKKELLEMDASKLLSDIQIARRKKLLETIRLPDRDEQHSLIKDIMKDADEAEAKSDSIEALVERERLKRESILKKGYPKDVEDDILGALGQLYEELHGRLNSGVSLSRKKPPR